MKIDDLINNDETTVDIGNFLDHLNEVLLGGNNTSENDESTEKRINFICGFITCLKAFFDKIQYGVRCFIWNLKK